MIETAIYVLVGALTAALAFLLVLPVVSRRAFRLAQRRLSLAAPLSATQAQAERDALRGRHAIEAALFERSAAEAQDKWAQAQIEIGRHAAELARRDDEMAERKAEIAALAEALREAREAIEAREATILDLSGQRDAAQAQAEAAISGQAALEARVAELTRELDEAKREAETALGDATDTIAELRGRLADSEAANDPEAARLPSVYVGGGEREALARETARLRAALAVSEARVDELSEGDERLRQAIVRLGRQMVARAATERAL